MSFQDVYDIPQPPPRHRKKVVKDKSLKDEVHYVLQRFYTDENKWEMVFPFDTKKNVESEKRNFIETEKRVGMTASKYRIVKYTTKKEVVK